MFDLTSVAAAPDEAVELELLHPKTNVPIIDSEGKPVTISLLSIDADRVIAHQADVRNRVLEAQRRSKHKQTAETEDAETVDLLTVATTGWSFSEMDGQPFTYSAVNARRFFSDRRYRAFRQQALLFIHERGNFMTR